MVQIWYPTQGDREPSRAPYLQDASGLTSVLAKVHRKPEFLFSNLKYINTHAIPSASVASEKPAYPVLIFLEGLNGFRQMNSFHVEELVSHGYIVAAIDHPYVAATVVFSDGRRADMMPLELLKALVSQSYLPAEQTPTLHGVAYEEGIIPYLAQDVLFTLSQLASLNNDDPNGILTGHLVLEHVGVFGVSLGGIVTGEVCRLVPRLQACLVLDAAMPARVVQSGLTQPSMWVTRDAETMRLERQQAGGWPEEEITAHLTSMRAVYESLPGDGYFVQVPGMFHINITDVPAWTPLVRLLGLSGPIEVGRAHSITNTLSLASFDRHLKGQPATLFDDVIEKHPEMLVELRRP